MNWNNCFLFLMFLNKQPPNKNNLPNTTWSDRRCSVVIDSLIKLCELFEQASILLWSIYSNQTSFIQFKSEKYDSTYIDPTTFKTVESFIHKNSVGINSTPVMIIESFINSNLDEYVEFVRFIKQTITETIMIPSDTQLFSKNFINLIGAVWEPSEYVYLKEYDSDVLDHHIRSCVNSTSRDSILEWFYSNIYNTLFTTSKMFNHLSSSQIFDYCKSPTRTMLNCNHYMFNEYINSVFKYYYRPYWINFNKPNQNYSTLLTYQNLFDVLFPHYKINDQLVLKLGYDCSLWQNQLHLYRKNGFQTTIID